MATQGPKKTDNDTIEVALLCTKDKTAVTVQIYSGNEEPMTYAEIADILYTLAKDIDESSGKFLDEDTKDGMLC